MSAPPHSKSRTDCGRPFTTFGPSATRRDHPDGVFVGGRRRAQSQVLALCTQTGARCSADLRDPKAKMFFHRREVAVVVQERMTALDRAGSDDDGGGFADRDTQRPQATIVAGGAYRHFGVQQGHNGGKPGHDILQSVKYPGDVKPPLAVGRAPRLTTFGSAARLTGHGLYPPHPYRRFRQCNYIMSRFSPDFRSGGRLKDIRSDVLERLAPIFE